MKKLAVLFLSCMILLSLLTGCAEKPPKGAGETFSYCLSAEPVTLDPQICTDGPGLTMIRAVFEGLVRLSPEGEPVPGMAESWESSAGDTLFTFHLREDAMWYGTGVEDDVPVTAEDFVFAFRRALDPATDSPLASQLFCIQNAASVHSGALPPEALGAYASDAHTLVVTLAYPCPHFPEMTAASVFMPCNEDFFYSTNGKYGISNNALLTNGPFKFAGYYAWEPYSHIELSRYNSYKGETDVWPASLYFYIGEAEIDLSDPVSLLLSGSLQAASLAEDQLPAAGREELSVLSAERAVCGLVFNTQNPLMESEALRSVFLSALDRDFLMEKLPENTRKADDILSSQIRFGGSSYRSLTESGLYYQEPFSSEAAQEAAASLGLSSLPSVTVLCEDREDVKQLVNQMIICWNNTLSGYFNMEPLSAGELSARVLSGDYQIALYEAVPLGDTPAALLELFTSDNPRNPAGLDDPVYDGYIREAAGSSGASAFLHAEEYLNDRCIFYPVYYTYSHYGLARGVSGIRALPYRGGLDFTSALLHPEG